MAKTIETCVICGNTPHPEDKAAYIKGCGICFQKYFDKYCAKRRDKTNMFDDLVKIAKDIADKHTQDILNPGHCLCSSCMIYYKAKDLQDEAAQIEAERANDLKKQKVARQSN